MRTAHILFHCAHEGRCERSQPGAVGVLAVTPSAAAFPSTPVPNRNGQLR
jgi:hypothetical protein